MKKKSKIDYSRFWSPAFDDMGSFVFLLDADFNLVRVNRLFTKFSGKKEKELIGKKCFSLVHNAKKPPAECPHQKMLKTKVFESGEFFDPNLKKWLSVNTTPIFDDKRNCVGSIHIAQDITDKKLIDEQQQKFSDKLRGKMNELQEKDQRLLEMNEDLMKSERKYRLLVETLQEGIWMIDHDANTIYVNPHMSKMLGYTENEMLGKSLFNFMDEAGVKLAKSHFERRRRGIAERHDFEFIRKDGMRIFASISTSPMMDEKGRFLGALASISDITERKKAEEALLLKTMLLEAQSETTLDGILVVDNEGHTVFLNKRFGEIWNIPQLVLDTKDDEKMLGYVLKQLKDPDGFKRKVDYLYHHKNEASRDEIEFTDGRRFDRYSSPLIDTSGRYHGRIWYFRDITERRNSKATSVK